MTHTLNRIGRNRTVRRAGAALVALLVLPAVLAACGDDDGGSTDATLAPGATEAPEGGDASGDTDGESAAAIVIRGFAFAEVSPVAAGEEIVVENADATTHTVTADDGSFDSGNIAGGQTGRFTVDEPGEYPFHCEIHPGMTGTLTVE